MTLKLSPEQLEFSPSSFVDPSGRLFRWNGGLYRAVRSERAALVETLVQRALAPDSQVSHLFPRTKVRSDLELEGFSLILEHQEIHPVSYPFEWPPELLKSSALTILRIAHWALDHGWAMSDGSPWNVVFDGVKPVFVDLGSFRPLSEEKSLLWAAYGQFCSHLLYPLYLYSAEYDLLVRDRLRDFQRGVDGETCARLLPSSRRLLSPQVVSRLEFPRWAGRVVKALQLETKLRSMPARPAGDRIDLNRRRFLESLIKDVEKISLPLPSTVWSDYDQGSESFDKETDWTPKQKSVLAVLEKTKPSTVLDVACNKGWFSELCARQGCSVVAFDFDPSAVRKLARRVKESKGQILPLCMDLLNPSPPLGWKLNQFSSALERFPSHLVLALALIHHLVISQMQSFSRVLQLLKVLTKRWLLIEFVPLDDPRSQQILGQFQREEFAWYTEANFLRALEQEFSNIERLPSWPEGRALYLCQSSDEPES